MEYVWVAVFGLIGVSARYLVGLFASRVTGELFPYGTLLINVVGAFAIGVVYVLGLERQQMPASIRVGVTVGLLGGFTTFSSYCLEAVRLFEEGETVLGALYLVGSPALGMLAAAAGLFLTRSFLGALP